MWKTRISGHTHAGSFTLNNTQRVFAKNREFWMFSCKMNPPRQNNSNLNTNPRENLASLGAFRGDPCIYQ